MFVFFSQHLLKPTLASSLKQWKRTFHLYPCAWCTLQLLLLLWQQWVSSKKKKPSGFCFVFSKLVRSSVTTHYYISSQHWYKISQADYIDYIFTWTLDVSFLFTNTKLWCFAFSCISTSSFYLHAQKWHDAFWWFSIRVELWHWAQLLLLYKHILHIKQLFSSMDAELKPTMLTRIVEQKLSVIKTRKLKNRLLIWAKWRLYAS